MTTITQLQATHFRRSTTGLLGRIAFLIRAAGSAIRETWREIASEGQLGPDPELTIGRRAGNRA